MERVVTFWGNRAYINCFKK